MKAQDPDKDIQFYINSPGGSVTAGMAIYDTMQYIKCDVATICVGLAASMGAFLLSAGTKGKRMALPNSEIMIHQPSAGTQGQITDMAIHLKRLETVKARMNRILSENTGRSIEEVTGRSYEAIHMIGGGTKDRLLCQMTADACRCEVVAGPIEATAMGNIAVQLIALGELKDLKEARRVIADSEPLKHYAPESPEVYDEAYGRFEKLL